MRLSFKFLYYLLLVLQLPEPSFQMSESEERYLACVSPQAAGLDTAGVMGGQFVICASNPGVTEVDGANPSARCYSDKSCTDPDPIDPNPMACCSMVCGDQHLANVVAACCACNHIINEAGADIHPTCTCPAAGMASASVQQSPLLPPLLQTKGGINHLPGPTAAGLTGPTTTGQTGPTTTGQATSGETTAEAALPTIPAGCDLNGEDISGTRLHVNMTGDCGAVHAAFTESMGLLQNHQTVKTATQTDDDLLTLLALGATNDAKKASPERRSLLATTGWDCG